MTGTRRGVGRGSGDWDEERCGAGKGDWDEERCGTGKGDWDEERCGTERGMNGTEVGVGSLERECGRGRVDELIEPLSPGVLSRDGVNGRRYFRPERFSSLAAFRFKKGPRRWPFLSLRVSAAYVARTVAAQSRGPEWEPLFPAVRQQLLLDLALGNLFGSG